MALKFRRGTTAQQSGSLAFGEPYVNTTLGTLVIGGASGDIVLGTSGTGSIGNFGAISGSGLDITGNARIGGNLTLGGALTIGDATADTINVVASISSSLIPNNDNTFDIGSRSKTYRTIYGNQISGSELLIQSGSNPQIRLINNTTGIEYHIQNGDGGNFQIHREVDGDDKLLFLFRSSSVLEGNQNAQFYGGLYVSTSVYTDRISATHISGSSIFATHGITGSIAATNGVISGSSQLPTLATTGSNTFKGNQTIIGSGAGFAAYISTSVNDATLGLDTTANVNALYFLKNGEKNFELSYDTTNANGIFRLLPYDNNSFFEIGNPSNSGANYVFISEPTYGNVLIGPGIGNGVSSLVGSTPATDKVQVTGNLYVSGAINANSFTGSIAATNGVVSGSSQVVGILSSLNTYTGSNDTTNTTQNTRLTRLEESTASLNSLTGSYAKTNTANVFTGNQTITGSLYITQDLVVQGSSSIQNITSSNLTIGAAFVTLNALTPSSNFAGIKVVDSGSTFTTASFIYDGLTNNWVFEKANVGSSDTSVAIFGPISTNGLGTELGLTQNKLPKAVSSHGHHIGDSNITDTGTLITLGSNTVVNGTIVASGTSLISGSSQINYGDLSFIPTGIISGSSQLLGYETTGRGIISGSSQLLGYETTGRGIISGSSQLLGYETTGRGIISGSSQLLGYETTGRGIVSGSSQINVASTTGDIALGSRTSGNYVASMTAGTGITVGTATGEGSTPVITNTGVTSNVAGTGVTVSGATGAVTISIGQAVATSSSPTFAGLTINGAITATGDITAYYTSDKRHKNNIQIIPNALEKVSKLNGVTWEWNDDVNEVTKSTPKTGLIAQEVQQVLPEVVIEKVDGFLGLDYSKMMGLMVEAIKEQQTQIHKLNLEIETLKSQKGL